MIARMEGSIRVDSLPVDGGPVLSVTYSDGSVETFDRVEDDHDRRCLVYQLRIAREGKPSE